MERLNAETYVDFFCLGKKKKVMSVFVDHLITGIRSFVWLNSIVVQRLGRAGIRRFCPRGGHQNSPFRG